MKSALGRGLGELLGEIDIAYDNENNITSDSIEEINVDIIIPNPSQPRTVFDESKIEELSESIKEHGLLQPINVTRDGDQYILIAGERRLRATKMANMDTIKAIVINVDDNKLAELALIENIQRSDLNIVELAKSYAKLINEYNITHDELSKKVSKSRSSITNTLRLLNLSNYVQDKLSSNTITLGHAKTMLGLDENSQKKIIDTIVGQKLSVRDTENLIKNVKESNKSVKTVSKTKLNIELLDKIIQDLKSKNIKSSLQNNSIKINFNSQEDIEIISKYFIK
ncbi:MAG: ParB/RepB/Spo0J family partition protein [Campylobacteraceae bacterium]|jgi:ParB family chromosome partitioning protein|nr:ParB/RepB/Spo0J family partition protein [Campylobacteraceae bacterium]MBT3882362.1 ParB/RepB/Spo0J family partition protein [Campylobacteraceae bacterium]MBT4031246.1 ParB/RepB/Spo0J family partition protein [Campylobacteraceae bacterium]MBT4178897.1 ParB/RepB/Spo0J family partition protein [Campylobacteraceae bacterium]MBT4573159.1 ParB/RepB/Spo0J family partition protein [Campylobacteraceae bacterium]